MTITPEHKLMLADRMRDAIKAYLDADPQNALPDKGDLLHDLIWAVDDYDEEVEIPSSPVKGAP